MFTEARIRVEGMVWYYLQEKRVHLQNVLLIKGFCLHFRMEIELDGNCLNNAYYTYVDKKKTY